MKITTRKKVIVMNMQHKLSENEIANKKSESIMNGVAYW